MTSFVCSSCVVSHWNELLCILLQIKIFVTLVSRMRNKHPNIVIIFICFFSINKKTKVKDPTHFGWISHDKKHRTSNTIAFGDQKIASHTFTTPMNNCHYFSFEMLDYSFVCCSEHDIHTKFLFSGSSFATVDIFIWFYRSIWGTIELVALCTGRFDWVFQFRSQTSQIKST